MVMQTPEANGGFIPDGNERNEMQCAESVLMLSIQEVRRVVKGC